MQQNTCKSGKNRRKMKQLRYQGEVPKLILDSLTKEQYYQYQIWDGIVKRLAFSHPRLLIPLIKEIFQKDYPEEVEMEFRTVEYILDDLQEIGIKKLRTIRADIVIEVGDEDIYHFECQIRPDSKMILRMYEYDTQIMLHYGFQQETGTSTDFLAFPQSVIIYLTHTSNTPDIAKQRVKFPNGQNMEYTVPIMKIQNYSLETIFEKKLYYILPLTTHCFYNYENYKCDINALTEHVKKSILMINEAVRNGDLTEREGNDIMGYVVYSVENMTIEEEEKLREKIFSTVPASLKLPWEKVEDAIKNFIESEKLENKSEEECCRKLQSIFSLSETEAKEKMSIYWKKEK